MTKHKDKKRKKRERRIKKDHARFRSLGLPGEHTYDEHVMRHSSLPWAKRVLDHKRRMAEK